MTTSRPALPLPPVELCRLSVDGPAGCADLAVPVSTPMSELLPVLVRHVAAGQDEQGIPWVLQRLGEDPLDPDGTPESLGLHHGDVLYLRPVDTPLPRLAFDDISDGVATVISDRPDRWRPEMTRRLALVLAWLAVVGLAATLLGAGPGAPAAVGCEAAAVILAGVSVLLQRAGAGAGATLVTGGGACLLAALAGLALPFGGTREYHLGVPGLTAAACGALIIAGALLLLRTEPPLLPGTVLVTAFVTAIGVALTSGAGMSPAQAAGVIACVIFVVGHMAPRIALRSARLRVPHLPHNAEELQEDIDPVEPELVARGVTIAGTFLDVLALSSALVHAVALWLLVHDHGWASEWLALLLGGAVLLSVRQPTGARQRVPLVVAGALGPALLLIVRGADTGPAGRAAVAVALLAGVVLLAVGAWRLPHSRLRPLWGHLGDILEMVIAVVLLPLLLQLLHVYAYFRALAG
ncbi:type VII secretion integral membrane protein EccD [Streptomyces sp. NPDC006668]|uniref:type VII secretion integral membrane protein EccD n=1 Tax=Streptomyces sp. NPDC006668 TaxID=3156903 RepID=UPI0033FD1C3A